MTAPLTGDALAALEPQDVIEVDGTRVNPHTLFQPEPAPRILSEQELLRIGAEEALGTNSQALQTHLRLQRDTYEAHSREALTEELLRRDENALRKGQDVADGRMAGKLLREFVRGMLHTLDHAELREIGAGASTKAGLVEHLLRSMGAEPAPSRELRLIGTTLGRPEGINPEIAIQQPDIRTFPSPQVAQEIRDRNAAANAQDTAHRAIIDTIVKETTEP